MYNQRRRNKELFKSSNTIAIPCIMSYRLVFQISQELQEISLEKLINEIQGKVSKPKISGWEFLKKKKKKKGLVGASLM